MFEETDQSWEELYPGVKFSENEDNTVDFNTPIKGKYICRIVSLERRIGVGKTSEKPYDMFCLKLQAIEDVEGNASGRRYLDKIYSNLDGEYSTAAENLQKLLNDLFTAGILETVRPSRGGVEGVEEIAPLLTDKKMNVSAYVNKGKQAIKIVKKFNSKEANTAAAASW